MDGASAAAVGVESIFRWCACPVPKRSTLTGASGLWLLVPPTGSLGEAPPSTSADTSSLLLTQHAEESAAQGLDPGL